MVFNSLTFLYIFLPIVIIGNLIIKENYRNVFVLIASIVFIAWFSVSYVSVFVISLLFNFIFGKLIYSQNDKKLFLFIGILFNVLLLSVFKYLNFFISNVNIIYSELNISELRLIKILLPIGISFYTFRAISYLIDIKRNRISAEQNFLHFALYFSFFPIIIAGPIYRYIDFKSQITERKPDTQIFSEGIERFIIGLAKKVLIANQLASLSSAFFEVPAENLGFINAWIGILAFTFQVYFDFSGYTDMAIGLCKMLGFNCPENFNFPYLARSIKDFWNRWHITLSHWLRDYVFLPQAYKISKRYKSDNYSIFKTDNLIYFEATLITFLICGIWHGANWTFVIWGLYQAVFLIIEQIGFRKWLKKRWKFLQHFYAFIIVVFGLVLFNSDNLKDAIGYYQSLFNFSENKNDAYLQSFYLNTEFYLVAFFAVFGSTKFFVNVNSFLQNFIANRKKWFIISVSTFSVIAKVLFYISVMFLSTLYLLANTYNPFIYFKF